MKTAFLWLLVLVGDGALHEATTHDNKKDCMRAGHVELHTNRSLDGFFCEQVKPEPVARELPRCFEPKENCA